MKVGISTVYNSENIGSFFQAYALKVYLESQGHSVFFLKRPIKTTSASAKYVTRHVVSLAMRGHFGAAACVLKMHRNFIAVRGVFPEIDIDKANVDMYILGSDEIWNVRQHTLRDYPPMWGVGMEASKTVAYGPSVNTSSADELRCAPYVENIKNIRMLSVRDAHTQQVLYEITGKKPDIVCDPVFLLTAESYLSATIPELEPYLLLYGYGEIADRKTIPIIMDYARDEKLRVYSYGFPKTWCEKTLCDSPLAYPMYCRKANAVITSTFHGTVFAILMGRQFAVFAGKNTKILMLLKQLGLQDRNASEYDVRGILNTEIAYSTVYVRIQEMIADSKCYLSKAVDAMKAGV